MAMLEVACPGCKTGLKAPDSMAGKKAKCKRCGTSFRIPGPPSDSIGESQMLSAIDFRADPLPSATPGVHTPGSPDANPFDFGGFTDEPSELEKPKKKAKPAPLPDPEPELGLDLAPEPATSADPFDFGGFGEDPPPPEK